MKTYLIIRPHAKRRAAAVAVARMRPSVHPSVSGGALSRLWGGE